MWLDCRLHHVKVAQICAAELEGPKERGSGGPQALARRQPAHLWLREDHRAWEQKPVG